MSKDADAMLEEIGDMINTLSKGMGVAPSDVIAAVGPKTDVEIEDKIEKIELLIESAEADLLAAAGLAKANDIVVPGLDKAYRATTEVVT